MHPRLEVLEAEAEEAGAAEVDYITSRGVEIRTNMRVGRDVTMDEIWNQGFKAILAAA